MSTILVVDDDPGILSAFVDLLQHTGQTVETVGRGDIALERIKRQRPDLLIMDIRMPGLSGLETFKRVKRIAPKLPVIIMTGYATMDTAIEATKLGAYDYQIKPLDPEAILRAISGALESVRLMQGNVALGPEIDDDPVEAALIGQSEGMREVFKQIGRVAPTDSTVLIRGETGTGKELVARAIYQHSRRFNKPLVVVNCVAIPDTLLESELFGHERGAFTGASHRRIGKFEQATGGTLFLDEVGDMPLMVQAKLLRVLQDGMVERLGGGESIQVSARILAATNRNLEQAIAEGKFREDLYHRLRVFALRLPPLRERRDDIPRLAHYFLRRLADEMGWETPILTEGGLEVLMAHAWPGNVRELQHTVQRALISTGGYALQAETIQRALENPEEGTGDDTELELDRVLHDLAGQVLRNHPGSGLYDRFTKAAERALIFEALKLARGNQTRAAALLGMARPTLKSKIDRHDIRIDEHQE